MLTRLKTLSGKGQVQGFTLIELLIVILIVGILAAVATPLYLGYIKDAKTAEAKALAGSLWTSVQSIGIANCGQDTAVSKGFPKAGLDSSGVSAPVRWSVSGGANTMQVNCNTGAYTVTSPLFTVTGTGADVNFIRVQLVYSATGTPPSKLQCSTDSGASLVDC